MSAHSADEQLLHRALELAREGMGLASPNPYVGAVIADALGKIVGTGSYTYGGVKHAEILALEEIASRCSFYYPLLRVRPPTLRLVRSKDGLRKKIYKIGPPFSGTYRLPFWEFLIEV